MLLVILNEAREIEFQIEFLNAFERVNKVE